MTEPIPILQSPFNKSRKDKFLMVLNLPVALKNISTDLTSSDTQIQPDTMEFSVYGSVVPEVLVPNVPVRYAGQTLEVSSHNRPEWPPLTVNFTVDNRFTNYWVLYTWLNMLNDDTTGIFDQNGFIKDTSTINPLYYNGNLPVQLLYRANISIFGLDEFNKRSIEFKYTGAFPTELGGITYNYRDEGEIESSFSFAYSQFKPELVQNVDNTQSV